MKPEEFFQIIEQNPYVKAGSEMHLVMHQLAQDALKITAQINQGYHTKEELHALVEKLIGKKIDPGFGLFPPLYTDCGKNIHLGKNVFFNAGCKLQDQGGIWIGDGTLVGHNVVFATINHDENPQNRSSMYLRPIHIGKNVWIGSNATILPGVTIGEGAIVAAGAVVTRNVTKNVVVAGVPAKEIRTIPIDFI